jgi:hypothetical protein
MRENNSKMRLLYPSSSKHLGVFFIKNRKKWSSRIHIDGINYHLGYFDTEEKASATYQYCLNDFLNNRNIPNKEFLGLKEKTSKHTGVCFNNTRKKWMSYFHFEGKVVYAGRTFSTEEEAFNQLQIKKKEYGV